MKTLLQILLAQKWISSKCVLFQNNLLPGDTVPLNELAFNQDVYESINLNNDNFVKQLFSLRGCYYIIETTCIQGKGLTI